MNDSSPESLPAMWGRIKSMLDNQRRDMHVQAQVLRRFVRADFGSDVSDIFSINVVVDTC
jgi:hypothetical protein